MMQNRRELHDDFEFQLGKCLKNEGLITDEDLEEAIRQQVIMGGHLSTNLWELGLVDGRLLSKFSAKLLKVREADATLVSRINAKTSGLLPREFAQRKRVLPLGVRRHILCAATCEPWDHLALGEAAFLSGYPVEVSYIAEVPLAKLLSQHYGIPLRARFRFPPPGVDQGFPDTAEVPWDELPELPAEIATVVTTVIQPPAANPVEDEPPLTPIDSLAEAIAALDAAVDRNWVGEVMLRFALSRGERVALLMHRREQWSGWMAAGEGVDKEGLSRLILPAAPGTAFGLVSQTGAHYMGPLVAHEVHQQFLTALGDVVPGAIGLFPVHFRGKLVFGVYLDGGNRGDIPTDVAEILLLAQRVPAILGRIIQAKHKKLK